MAWWILFSTCLAGTNQEYIQIIPGFLEDYNWDPTGKRTMITGVSESDISGGVSSSDSYVLSFFTFDLSIIPGRPYYGTWLIKPSLTLEPATVVLFGCHLNLKKSLLPIRLNLCHYFATTYGSGKRCGKKAES
jgi:hypothetical protein